MAMRRAQDRQMGGVAPDRQIVDVAAAAGQKSGILDTFHGPADQAARRLQTLHVLLPHPLVSGCRGEKGEGGRAIGRYRRVSDLTEESQNRRLRAG